MATNVRICIFSKVSLLVIAFLYLATSCKNENKNNSGADLINSSTEAKSSINAVDGDPALDTISKFSPSGITRNVLVDRNGNIWLASWDGIICYDGKNFTNYTLKAGLRQFHICSILEDSKGWLWFGTIGAGVYKFDGSNFVNFTTTDHLAGNTVFSLVEDKSKNIYFGTDKGVSRYDGNSFVNYTTDQGLSGNSIQALALDQRGKIWIGTHTGISVFDGKSFVNFKNENGDSFYNVRFLHFDRSGKLWISSREGLGVFDGNLLTSVSTYLTGNIFEDRNGDLWFSGGGANSPDIALSKYDGKKFIEVISKKGGNFEGLREIDKQIFGITQDRIGNIWFGTAGGVCRYDGILFDTFEINS